MKGGSEAAGADREPGYYPPMDNRCTVDLLRPGRSIHLRCPTQGLPSFPPQVDKESVTRYLLGVLVNPSARQHQDLSLTFAFRSASRRLLPLQPRPQARRQLPAHRPGHRSPVEILVDGERDEELEFNWAERWADIYLGTEEDRVALGELALSERAEASLKEGDAHYIGFKYVAPQGCSSSPCRRWRWR